MKNSTERTRCINGSCRSGGSLIFRKIFFGKLITKCLTLLYYFNGETTKVLSKVQFLKSHFFRSIRIAISFNIKHTPLSLAGPLVACYLDIRKFWFI